MPRVTITLAALALIALACSSPNGASAPAPCLSDPLACSAGTTCWATDDTPSFACLPSAHGGAAGAPCQNTIGAPTCGDGLTCDQTGAGGGTCTHFCDARTPCPAGSTCVETHAGSNAGPALYICRQGTASPAPPASAPDAGTDDPSTEAPDAAPDSAPSSR